MSLVGFKAQNHQQQVLVHGPRSHVDDRALPPEDFALLQGRFGFTIDIAAAPHNAKLSRFWTIKDDALAQSWAGERVYCNPPYSSIEPWLQKAHDEWLLGRPELIVMLLPANRTEQKWWQRQVEPFRDRGGDLRVEFLPGRLRFLKPGQKRIGPNERPPFGCCLLIWALGVSTIADRCAVEGDERICPYCGKPLVRREGDASCPRCNSSKCATPLLGHLLRAAA